MTQVRSLRFYLSGVGWKQRCEYEETGALSPHNPEWVNLHLHPAEGDPDDDCYHSCFDHAALFWFSFLFFPLHSLSLWTLSFHLVDTGLRCWLRVWNDELVSFDQINNLSGLRVHICVLGMTMLTLIPSQRQRARMSRREATACPPPSLVMAAGLFCPLPRQNDSELVWPGG